jgi:hypothetical protein
VRREEFHLVAVRVPGVGPGQGLLTRLLTRPRRTRRTRGRERDGMERATCDEQDRKDIAVRAERDLISS